MWTTTTNTVNTAWPPLYQEWLDRLTYKPGWEFLIGGGPDHFYLLNPTLRITAQVMDSNAPDPYNPTLITHLFPLPPGFDMMNQADFYSLVLGYVDLVERHEAREFFKVDGQRHLDPHRDGNTHLYD